MPRIMDESYRYVQPGATEAIIWLLPEAAEIC